MNATTSDQDLQQLNLLSIFYFVYGGLTALVGCFPIFHLGFGIAMLTGQLETDGGEAQTVGALFVGVAATLMCLIWGMAAATVAAGLFLRQRRGWLFCLIMAGLACLSVPLGTLLGVFTIIVLTRPNVQAMFGRGPQGNLPGVV